VSQSGWFHELPAIRRNIPSNVKLCQGLISYFYKISKVSKLPPYDQLFKGFTFLYFMVVKIEIAGIIRPQNSETQEMPVRVASRPDQPLEGAPSF
jgi:hypothetical protein